MEQKILIKLHKVMLELLDEFVSICEKNNLSYFLTAGTLLGAIRHKGFIPWDDDIDVAMPRIDYEAFLTIFESQNSENYYLLSHKCPKDNIYHYMAFAKLCKKNTVFAEENINGSNYTGIYIDIWPFDNCKYLFVPLQTKLIKFFVKIYPIKAKVHKPVTKLYFIITKILCIFLPLRLVGYCNINLYLLFNNKYTKYISFFTGRYGYKKETHRHDDIYPLSKVLFENRNYNAPKNWHLFLTKLYGNYMEIPPPEKRHHHNPSYILF